MHCLYGLQKQGYDFQLKGGTSLSKGYRLIDRFSEDIDIHINPPKKLGINENPKNTNRNNIERKKQFYKKLASEIKIDGVREIKRDTAFDDLNGYNSAGIRLLYESVTSPIEGVKEGILLAKSDSACLESNSSNLFPGTTHFHTDSSACLNPPPSIPQTPELILSCLQ